MQLNNATYQYDANGNMTHDGRRGLDLSWNHLNLPSTISTDEDEDATVNYSYLLDGTKVLAQAPGTGEGYAYLGTMVYKLNNGSWTLETTPFTGGRFIRNTSGNFVEQRHITDHLGSTRTIVEDDDYIEVEQNDYYPFGKRIADNSLPTTATNRWRFSGKEIQTLGGIGLVDFGARMYDDFSGRWKTRDGLSEKGYNQSLYNYCTNNPINHFDPNGLSTEVVADSLGRYIVTGGTINDDTGVYLITINSDGTMNKTLVGQTLTATSFYNSDTDTWAIGSIIDPNDQSGMQFLERVKFIGLTPYMILARPGGLFDFKITNAEPQSNRGDYTGKEYRGMPISSNGSITVYASARDIGNYAAGYVAGLNSVSWGLSRIAFDALQTVSTNVKIIRENGLQGLKLNKETASSVNAQLVGWQAGWQNSVVHIGYTLWKIK